MSCNARPLVLCGPSGVGKSTLIKRLTSEFKDAFGFSVSHTTRKPRDGEKDGVHYHFVSLEEMKASVAEGNFIESATFSGNMYGTSKNAVQTVMEKGQICILDIEMQGVIQIKEKFDSILKPFYVFVRPPSMEILEKRLRERGTETEDSLKRRMDTARDEMKFGERENYFDLVMVNDDLDKAYEKLRNLMLPEIEKNQNKK